VAIPPPERVGLGDRDGSSRREPERGRQCLLEAFQVHGLDQEVAGAQTHGPHGIGHFRAAAHDDDGRRRRLGADRIDDAEAIHARHAQVGHDRIEALAIESLYATRAIRDDDVIGSGAKQPCQSPAQCLFIVTKQNLRHTVTSKRRPILHVDPTEGRARMQEITPS
jgi:hypothetical protein